MRIVADFSNGDARAALTMLDMLVTNTEESEDGSLKITKEFIEEC